MPVKIWELKDGDVLASRVETERHDSLRGERFRADADELDRRIDAMLDEAVALSVSGPGANASQGAFVRRWAVGRALAESGLMESVQLDPGEERWLWLAMARKCRLGVRADGSPQESWRDLIPDREADPRRVERDVFALGSWLQEQDLEPAMAAFGASLANAQEIHRRGAINSQGLRDALARWFVELPDVHRAAFIKRDTFRLLAKALAKRFPARGPGSAKRPVHYTGEALYGEVRKVLDPVAAELAGDGAQPP